jgi:hypothetical protein
MAMITQATSKSGTISLIFKNKLEKKEFQNILKFRKSSISVISSRKPIKSRHPAGYKVEEFRGILSAIACINCILLP